MKRSSKKLPKDTNQLAAEIVRLSTEEPEKPQEQTPPIKLSNEALSQYFSEMGRKGGLKGGKARAQKLSKKQRSEIARKAAKKRWEGKKP